MINTNLGTPFIPRCPPCMYWHLLNSTTQEYVANIVKPGYTLPKLKPRPGDVCIEEVPEEASAFFASLMDPAEVEEDEEVEEQ